VPSSRRTEQAVAEAVPLRGSGAGSADPLAGELRRAGVLPLLVLHFLGDGPSYGGALMEKVETLSRGLIGVNPNTMYPLLRRLEADGFVAGEWEHPERRSRRFYRLTEAGAAERDRLAVEAGPRLDAMVAALGDIKSALGV
jgi:PadR family transcriptional regulator, regulatory protein PadR